MLQLFTAAQQMIQLGAFQRVIRYLETIAVSDLVDIAIIAFILYRLIRLMRNSQAAQVIKGIVFVMILQGLSDLLQLHVLNFLLKSVVQVGFIALIVVFQPEIRHFLGQMGSNNLRRLLMKEEDEDTLKKAIHETVSAYQQMSKGKVGALTVFERNSLLSDQIRNGSPLDAAVSDELLKNIFYPKAPLHDGAVIVREGRIVAAGCVLPLSDNPNISRELGTRHRAGLGISEHTDAVVVICSEETGSVSVAMGGVLKRHLAPETLERLLCNELLADENAKKLLFTNFTSANLLNWLRGRKEDESDVE
jgi:diadenylate cyclase